MLKFDLIYDNEGILTQAITDLVEGLFIGIGSLSEPFTTDKKFGAFDMQERGALADRVASRLSVPSSHLDLEGLRSGRLTTVAAATRFLMQKFNGAIWSEEIVRN